MVCLEVHIGRFIMDVSMQFVIPPTMKYMKFSKDISQCSNINCAFRLKQNAKDEILVRALRRLIDLLAQEAGTREGPKYIRNLLRRAVS